MASKRVQEIVDRFVAELTAASEEEATEALQERIRDMLGGSMKGQVLIPAKRRKTTKGYTVLRPCPVPDCKEIAAPRYQMVCKGHGETLSREDILVHRDNASKPGGVWFDLVPGKPWRGLRAALARAKKAG
jgi:hypothetical protein